MPQSSGSDSDAPEAISLKTAKKSSKAQDKLVLDRNSKVAKLAKDKNRARDTRLKATKEATNRNSRSIESNPSSEEKGGTKKKRLLRKPVDLLPPSEGDSGSEDRMIDVEPNGEDEDEDEDPTQKRIRMRMEAAMRDAESEGADPDPDGLSDADVEGLDGSFAFGTGEGEDSSITDGEVGLEEISEDDEEMKNSGTEDEDEDTDEAEWTGSIGTNVGIGGPGRDALPARKRKRGEEALPPGDQAALGNPDYLSDELFAQAAASITAGVARKQADSKAKEVKRKKKKAKRTKSKDLVVGSRTVQVIRPLNPATMASYTVPSKSAQQFVKRRLKGGLTTKGWQRRPVNVGSLSVRGGPAKGFRRT